jgi:hypothetical protein
MMSKIRLAVIGDSLSQGFMSGAIYRTDLSYPVLLSWCLGFEKEFSYPQFNEEYGLPLNLELLLHKLTDQFGGKIDLREMMPLVKETLGFVQGVEKFWDNEGRRLASFQTLPYNNQASWGFKLQDWDSLTAAHGEDFLNRHPPWGRHFFRDFWIPFYITAKQTLNPLDTIKGREMTQIDNLKLLSAQRGGIENLIFWLGANNALGAVSTLKLNLSTAGDLTKLHHETKANLYRPEHFEFLYRRVTDRLQTVRAERVFLATIPYVTVPPVTRGVSLNTDNPCPEGYFDYYTRPWIWDDEFNPKRHPHLTREQVKLIDKYIDQYNQIIKQVAREKGWYVVDIGQLLSDIAYRRRRGAVARGLPNGLRNALYRNPLTSYLVDEQGKVALDTRFIEIRLNPSPKIVKGGLFSLDGIHPTTIGYGVIADAFLKVMVQAGVRNLRELPWEFIVASDTLITNPPAALEGLRELFIFLRSTKVFNSNLLEVLIKGVKN